MGDVDGDGEISYLEFESFVESPECKDADVQDVLDRLREIAEGQGGSIAKRIEEMFEELEEEDKSGERELDANMLEELMSHELGLDVHPEVAINPIMLYKLTQQKAEQREVTVRRRQQEYTVTQQQGFTSAQPTT